MTHIVEMLNIKSAIFIVPHVFVGRRIDTFHQGNQFRMMPNRDGLQLDKIGNRNHLKLKIRYDFLFLQARIKLSFLFRELKALREFMVKPLADLVLWHYLFKFIL